MCQSSATSVVASQPLVSTSHPELKLPQHTKIRHLVYLLLPCDVCPQSHPPWGPHALTPRPARLPTNSALLPPTLTLSTPHPLPVQAMCMDYYTLDFMDPGVDTTPIAPALAAFFDDVLQVRWSREAPQGPVGWLASSLLSSIFLLLGRAGRWGRWGGASTTLCCLASPLHTITCCAPRGPQDSACQTLNPQDVVC